MRESVLSFFNSAVIIDDQLPGGASHVVTDEPLAGRPAALMKTFQEAGVVISPFPYVLKIHDRAYVEQIAKLARRARLTVLDWHLVGESRAPATDLIHHLMKSTKSGMRWIIVYTQTELIDQEPTELIGGLRGLFVGDAAVLALLDEAADRHQAHPDEPLRIGGIFVSFMAKQYPPDDVINELAKKLRRSFGPLAEPLLVLGDRLEQQSYNGLLRFTKPFDLSLHLHAHCAGLTDAETAEFLYRLHAQSMNRIDLSPAVAALRNQRGESVKLLTAKVQADNAILQDLQALLRTVDTADPTTGGKKSIFDQSEGKWLKALDAATAGNNQAIARYVEQVGRRPDNDGDLRERTYCEFLLAFIEWKDQYPEKRVADFFAQIRKQAYEFAWMLKYEWNGSWTKGDPIDTGMIFVDKTKGEYLLCISPYCDTFRPKENLENHYKFLTGTDRPERIGKKNDRSHGTFVPFGGDLHYVVWEHFKTTVLNPGEPAPAPDALRKWIGEGCDCTNLAAVIPVILPCLRSEAAIYGAAFVMLTYVQKVPANLRDAITEYLFSPLPGEIGGTQAAFARAQAVWRTKAQGSRPEALLAGLIKKAPFDGYEFVGQLKREYIQQIMNHYVAYHSRAGVSELFYKEKAQPLYELFGRLPAHAEKIAPIQEELSISAEVALWLSKQESQSALKEIIARVGSGHERALRMVAAAPRNLPDCSGVTNERLAEALQLIAGGRVVPEAFGRLLRAIAGSAEPALKVAHEQNLLALDQKELLDQIRERVAEYVQKNPDWAKNRKNAQTQCTSKVVKALNDRATDQQVWDQVERMLTVLEDFGALPPVFAGTPSK